MANETIGQINCFVCASPRGEVRKNARGKLYYYCDNCGLIQGTLAGFQNAILENAVMAAPGAPADVVAPEPEPNPIPAPEPEPVRAPVKPEPEKKGFLDSFFEGF